MTPPHNHYRSTGLVALRASVLGTQLEGVAEVLPHGGLSFVAGVELVTLEQKARGVVDFYTGVNDRQKWDFIDYWFVVKPLVPKLQRCAYQDELFQQYAKQLRNWISMAGRYAENVDGKRRPWLPFWLHCLVHKCGLDDAEADTVFGHYEAALQARKRLTRVQVEEFIQARFNKPHQEWADHADEEETSEPAGYIDAYLSDPRWKVVETVLDETTFKKKINTFFRDTIELKV